MRKLQESKRHQLAEVCKEMTGDLTNYQQLMVLQKADQTHFLPEDALEDEIYKSRVWIRCMRFVLKNPKCVEEMRQKNLNWHQAYRLAQSDVLRQWEGLLN